MEDGELECAWWRAMKRKWQVKWQENDALEKASSTQPLSVTMPVVVCWQCLSFWPTRQWCALLHSIERLALPFCSDLNYCVGFELTLRIVLYKVCLNFSPIPRFRAWAHAATNLLGERIEGVLFKYEGVQIQLGGRRGNHYANMCIHETQRGTQKQRWTHLGFCKGKSWFPPKRKIKLLTGNQSCVCTPLCSHHFLLICFNQFPISFFSPSWEKLHYHLFGGEGGGGKGQKSGMGRPNRVATLLPEQCCVTCLGKIKEKKYFTKVSVRMLRLQRGSRQPG